MQASFLDFAPRDFRDYQVRAAGIFFGDVVRRYAAQREQNRKMMEAPNRIRTAEARTFDVKDFMAMRDTTMRLFEENAIAYEVAAANESMTFNLDVESRPQYATLSYKKLGDPYTIHPKPTDTRIENLTYAIWTVRVQEDKYQDAEKEHNPFREPNHVVHFDLVPK